MVLLGRYVFDIFTASLLLPTTAFISASYMYVQGSGIPSNITSQCRSSCENVQPLQQTNSKCSVLPKFKRGRRYMHIAKLSCGSKSPSNQSIKVGDGTVSCGPGERMTTLCSQQETLRHDALLSFDTIM